MRYIAVDGRGHELALLEGVRDYAHAFDEAIIKRRVPGAVNVVGDNADGEGDMKAAESQLVASFREGGLSEKEAKIAARGRYDPPTRILRTIHVRRDDANATTRSSSTGLISEQERELRSVELHEPGSIDLASDGLTELKERGVRNSGTEALTDLYRAFRADGLSEKAAMVAARGRDSSSAIREAGQTLGVTPPPAFAQLLNYKAPDGTSTYQWRVPVCPLCSLRHLIPDPATTMDDPNALLGEQAMPCGKGLAVLTDAATNPPPDSANLYKVANPDTLGAAEAGRGGDELAEAEARLYESFRAGGLSEAEARVAARGRAQR